MPTKPSRTLEIFPNPKPGPPFEIAMVCPEFTCVCPMTGQPDFGTIRLRYVPNRICDDLVKAIAPRWIEVVGDFAVRGGIHTEVTARHGRRPAE